MTMLWQSDLAPNLGWPTFLDPSPTMTKAIVPIPTKVPLPILAAPPATMSRQ